MNASILLTMLAAISVVGMTCLGEGAPTGVIPQPRSMKEAGISFLLAPGAAVDLNGMSYTEALAELERAAGFPLRAVASGESAAILFEKGDIGALEGPAIMDEAYLLRIGEKGIRIVAPAAAGQFYGLQTLLQLLEQEPREEGGKVRLEGMVLRDAPRYAWRGFMLDESRNFSGVEPVKRILDAMARYKLNRFHWHLTDSPGWRIEIKKYPLLTEIGSRGSQSDQRPDAPQQFYTQAQVRDVVAYAKARHIVVVPEIDMPGHADAAVRSYPEHDGGGMTQGPDGGPPRWPRFTFNPARPATLAFLDDILAEVAQLFPDAGVLHFGGDEVTYGNKKWTNLVEVQDLMASQGLADRAAVEDWFHRRMIRRINELGFTAGGWDEIAERGLQEGKVLVFWWRQDKRDLLRRALDDGRNVVLCPRHPFYFDFVQDAEHLSGRTDRKTVNTLEKVYTFSEAECGVKPEDLPQIRGIQACLWTEMAGRQPRRDFMAFPRLLALAELVWSADDVRDFNSFMDRLKTQLPWLRERGLTVWDPFERTPEVAH